jgi:hypothetical protein
MKRLWLICCTLVLVALASHSWWSHSTRHWTARNHASTLRHADFFLDRPCPDSGVRIYVSEYGVVTLNGRVINLEDLREALVSLKPAPSEVCFSHGTPASQETETAVSAAVVAAGRTILDSKLPRSTYTDATFQTQEKCAC